MHPIFVDIYDIQVEFCRNNDLKNPNKEEKQRIFVDSFGIQTERQRGFMVDVINPAPVEVGSLSHDLQGFCTSQVVSRISFINCYGGMAHLRLM